MRKTICIAIAFVSSSAFCRDLFCTINHLKKSDIGWAEGRIIGLPKVDLAKKSEFNNFLVKRDGSLISNVRYADMMNENPSNKLGDVDGAVFIALSRDQGEKEGINISMGTLRNDQKMASDEVAASSSNDQITLYYVTKAVFIHCQGPSK